MEWHSCRLLPLVFTILLGCKLHRMQRHALVRRCIRSIASGFRTWSWGRIFRCKNFDKKLGINKSQNRNEICNFFLWFFCLFPPVHCFRIPTVLVGCVVVKMIEKVGSFRWNNKVPIGIVHFLLFSIVRKFCNLDLFRVNKKKKFVSK